MATSSFVRSTRHMLDEADGPLSNPVRTRLSGRLRVGASRRHGIVRNGIGRRGMGTHGISTHGIGTVVSCRPYGDVFFELGLRDATTPSTALSVVRYLAGVRSVLRSH